MGAHAVDVGGDVLVPDDDQQPLAVPARGPAEVPGLCPHKPLILQQGLEQKPGEVWIGNVLLGTRGEGGERAAHGRGGVPIPGGVLQMCGWGNGWI